MGVVSFPLAQRHTNVPLVMFLDLQVEYVATGRAYSLANAEACLANCKAILDKARLRKLPIAHFRQLHPAAFFNEQSPFAAWIEDFRPRASEMVFERSRPSCYANPGFRSFIEKINVLELIVVGLAGEKSCLATILEAADNGHPTTFVTDASASHAFGGRDEAESHQAVVDIVGLYSDLTNTETLLSRLDEIEPAASSFF